MQGVTHDSLNGTGDGTGAKRAHLLRRRVAGRGWGAPAAANWDGEAAQTAAWANGRWSCWGLLGLLGVGYVIGAKPRKRHAQSWSCKPHHAGESTGPAFCITSAHGAVCSSSLLPPPSFLPPALPSRAPRPPAAFSARPLTPPPPPRAHLPRRHVVAPLPDRRAVRGARARLLPRRQPQRAQLRRARL